jgi:CheY-like chemotaxis protein
MTAMRCLIVDDNERFLQVARDLLEREGIDVVGVATSSAEALRQAEQLRPDVALIDIFLGDEFGVEVAHLLTQSVPEPPRMIMISAYAKEDFIELIAASTAIGFLSKTRLSGSAIQTLVENADDPP